jgi:hypothetical protein
LIDFCTEEVFFSPRTTPHHRVLSTPQHISGFLRVSPVKHRQDGQLHDR